MAWFGLHFLLIISFSCRDTLWLIGQGLTIFPPSFKAFSQKAEGVVSAVLGQHLAASNPLRQTLATYLHLVGIERGYGYFAPNVPGAYKLVFELHHPGGRVQYVVPRVNSAAAGLRVASLLDEIGRTHSDALREYIVKMLAHSTWREYPEAKTIRAVFGAVTLPTLSEFQHGKRETYNFLYAYDFSRHDAPGGSTNPKEDKP